MHNMVEKIFSINIAPVRSRGGSLVVTMLVTFNIKFTDVKFGCLSIRVHKDLEGWQRTSHYKALRKRKYFLSCVKQRD
jgi:hypothetical protein